MNTDQIPICLCCKYPLDDESIEAGEHSMCQNVCPVCNGDGRKECDVETTTGTVKQYDGPCDKCGGTGLVKPSASVQPLNDGANPTAAGDDCGRH